MALRHLRITVFPGMDSLDIVLGSVLQQRWRHGVWGKVTFLLPPPPHSRTVLTVLSSRLAECPRKQLSTDPALSRTILLVRIWNHGGWILIFRKRKALAQAFCSMLSVHCTGCNSWHNSRSYFWFIHFLFVGTLIWYFWAQSLIHSSSEVLL